MERKSVGNEEKKRYPKTMTGEITREFVKSQSLKLQPKFKKTKHANEDNLSSTINFVFGDVLYQLEQIGNDNKERRNNFSRMKKLLSTQNENERETFKEDQTQEFEQIISNQFGVILDSYDLQLKNLKEHLDLIRKIKNERSRTNNEDLNEEIKRCLLVEEKNIKIEISNIESYKINLERSVKKIKKNYDQEKKRENEAKKENSDPKQDLNSQKEECNNIQKEENIEENKVNDSKYGAVDQKTFFDESDENLSAFLECGKKILNEIFLFQKCFCEKNISDFNYENIKVLKDQIEELFRKVKTNNLKVFKETNFLKLYLKSFCKLIEIFQKKVKKDLKNLDLFYSIYNNIHQIKEQRELLKDICQEIKSNEKNNFRIEESSLEKIELFLLKIQDSLQVIHNPLEKESVVLISSLILDVEESNFDLLFLQNVLNNKIVMETRLHVNQCKKFRELFSLFSPKYKKNLEIIKKLLKDVNEGLDKELLKKSLVLMNELTQDHGKISKCKIPDFLKPALNQVNKEYFNIKNAISLIKYIIFIRKRDKVTILENIETHNKNLSKMRNGIIKAVGELTVFYADGLYEQVLIILERTTHTIQKLGKEMLKHYSRFDSIKFSFSESTPNFGEIIEVYTTLKIEHQEKVIEIKEILEKHSSYFVLLEEDESEIEIFSPIESKTEDSFSKTREVLPLMGIGEEKKKKDKISFNRLFSKIFIPKCSAEPLVSRSTSSSSVAEALSDKIIFFGEVNLKGVKQGIGKEFYKTGELKFSGEWNQGRKEGFGTEYLKNGQVKRTGFYKFGVLTAMTVLPNAELIENTKISSQIKNKKQTKIDGDVYYVENTQYALKRINLNRIDEKQFLKECKIMDHLDHNNIVKFYTILYNEKKRPIGYVMEYLENGSIFELIKKYNNIEEEIDFEWKVRILYQTACGLKYLVSKKVIHGDIKWQNVLLNKINNVKIIDFGLSKIKTIIEEDSSSGTKYYQAPEVTKDGDISEFSDVFSFGIMMFELICQTVNPYKRDLKKDFEKGFAIQRAVANDSSFRPRPSDFNVRINHENRWIFSLMSKCWKHEKSERPTFKHIVEVIYSNLPHFEVLKI